jgi:hypothetical protein
MAFLAIAGAAGSGGKIVNPKPTITYNSYPGIFNITNNDSTGNYSSYSTVTGGTISFSPTKSTVTLSNAGTTATIANRSAKGVTTSPTTLAERKSYSYVYVDAPPPFNVGCDPYTGCGGTRHGGECMAFFGSPYTYLQPSPGYSAGGSEWYKIT